MKFIDVIAAILLVAGGLNWGLVGLFNFNFVETIFGLGGLLRVMYTVIGLSACFQILQFKAIQRRWK